MVFFKKTNKHKKKVESNDLHLHLQPQPQPQPSNTITVEQVTLTYLENIMEAKEISNNVVNQLSTILSKIPRDQRRILFGKQKLPEPPLPSFLKIAINASKDKVLILLMISSIFSIVIGISESNTSSPPTTDNDGPPPWMEGLGIGVAVILVILVNSINDFKREMQFRNLSLLSEDRMITIVDDGDHKKKKEIPIHEMVVGDIVHISPGDIIASDGCIMPGQADVLTDCSSFTGESRSISKGPKDDFFILEGTKIMRGCSKYLVILVGKNTMYGKMILGMRGQHGDSEMVDIEEHDKRTPLQGKLDSLAEVIAKIGMISSLILFILLLGYKSQNWAMKDRHIMKDVIDVVMEAITVIVVAVPEGLPMAVTLALAWASSQMSKDSCLVRVLSSCEVMGGVTSICSDKTGTLTQNKMTVTNTFIPGMSHSGIVPLIIQEGIRCNTTSFWDHGLKTWIGSGTEVALLRFIEKISATEEFDVSDRIDFDSSLKYMATTITKKDGSITHWKGGSEIILEHCTKIRCSDGSIKGIDKEMSNILSFQNQQSSNGGLRIIALAYKNGPLGTAVLNDGDSHISDGGRRPKSLTLLCLLAIEDPLREGVKEAVEKCQKAGVMVRMLTGDSEETARSIAKKAGILSRDGLVLDGETFRSLPPDRLRAILPRLQVLARSSPEDKRVLVKGLKDYCQEIVAVTGDGTNDGPALREGDVSFSMGKSGTEVAKEASSIILLGDDFTSILTALLWGRGVTENVRKFLQFQLTVNVSAVLTCFISAALLEGQTILSPLQLLWVNLIMDALGALALATDPPNEEVLLSRRPEPRSSPLISWTMLKAIICQSLFQLSIMTFIIVQGDKRSSKRALLKSFSFNTFVMMQLFNELNCRFLSRRPKGWKLSLKNLLELFLLPVKNLKNNTIFSSIWLSCFVVQIILIEFCSTIMGTIGLSFKNWTISILLGALSLIIGFFIRLIPGDEESDIRISDGNSTII